MQANGADLFSGYALGKSIASPPEAISAPDSVPRNPTRSDLEAAVRRALALLNRASSEWRASAGDNGPLHWPTAIAFATRELRDALEAAHRGNGGCKRPLGDELLCAHCGGTGFDGDEPCAFCEGAGRDALAEDDRAGIAWFNALTSPERSWWLSVAESARPADAWRAFQTWEDR